MKDLCFDVETTTFNKGSPFDRRNELCCIAYTDGERTRTLLPGVQARAEVQEALDQCDRIVGFNLKFDLHWLRRFGVRFDHRRVYDVQAAEFILSGQTHKFPSLNEVSAKYLGKSKIDEVAALWDRGIQTTDIPWETLSAYAAEDVQLTLSVSKKQQALREFYGLGKLISLVNQDLLVLEEMEWNGIKFDRGLAEEKAADLEIKIVELQGRHNVLHNVPNFNWSSGDHLRALLYGGEIKEPIKVPVGHFKTGDKAGQVKFKNDVRIHKLPRMFKPPKQLTDGGKYAVDEAALLELGETELIKDLLEIKKIQKEVSTYLRGLMKKQDEGCYSDYIYGKFNQCVAATGRLSSSDPNLQNLSEEAGRCFMSRYS